MSTISYLLAVTLFYSHLTGIIYYRPDCPGLEGNWLVECQGLAGFVDDVTGLGFV